jgi:hypothetical protein
MPLTLRPLGPRYLLLFAALLLGCAQPVTRPDKAAGAPRALALPAQLEGKAVLVDAADPDYVRAALGDAIKVAGEGGIKEGLVVRLLGDLPVWRLWSGPAKRDARGNTNRIGQWWGYDAPHGARQDYRRNYEICNAWNDLTWVARCTLKKGAVVAIGPGNSVSPKLCGDATGQEQYPMNDRDWQLWIAKAWSRAKELDCPAEDSDYEASPSDIATPAAK